METLNFGIMATGRIARNFTKVCAKTNGVRAYAVASRTPERARAFARENGVEKSYGSYAGLAADPQVHAVYVATPHTLHFENCMLALQNGKHVLCEKPMVMTHAQAKTLFDYAKAHGLFLMEAMWSRFLPFAQTARRWIDQGLIGRVRFIDSILSFAASNPDPAHRLVNPALGGGALYDLGIYSVEMSSFFAGANPEAYAGLHTPYCKGTDAMAAIVARYPGDILATMRTGLVVQSDERMTVTGDTGRIELSRPHFITDLRRYEQNVLAEELHMELEGANGQTWQLAAVRDDILAGRTESSVVPHADTLASIAVLEELKRSFDAAERLSGGSGFESTPVAPKTV